MHEATALGSHQADLRRVDLIHFAGNKENSDGDFLVVLFIDDDGGRSEFVEDADGEVLGVFGDFFLEGEDPSNGKFSILIIDRFDGIGGGVGRLGESRQRGTFL